MSNNNDSNSHQPTAGGGRRPINVDYVAPSNDIRTALARSMQLARAVAAELTEATAGRATPCPEWNALDVARHILAVFDRVVAAPTGADLIAMPLLSEATLDDIGEHLDAAAEAAAAAWADDELLGQTISAPFGELPGAAVLGVWAGELVAHSWDLAVAIGVEPNWPEPDTEISYQMASSSLPDDGRHLEEMPFSPAIELSDDAPAIERLVAWLGREPSDWVS